MKRLTLLLALCLLSGLLLAYSSRSHPAVAQTAAPPLPPGPFVARVYYDDVSDLQELAAYDLWEYNDLVDQYALLSLDKASYDLLQEQGWRLQVDQEQTRRLSTTFAPFSDGYHSVAEIYDTLNQLNSDNPGIVELVPYGESACLARTGCTTPGGDSLPGFELLALRVTNEATPGSSQVEAEQVIRGSKPVFFILANIHARELATSEIALQFIEHLLEQYRRDPIITYLIDWHELWIVPTANPDGRWLVELGARPSYDQGAFYQRKNAHQDADEDGAADCLVWPPQSSWQYGVDLNRNHSFFWGGPGASMAPCDQTFRGPAPASEPEVGDLETLVTSLIADQRGEAPSAPAPRSTKGFLLTLHSFGDFILWPWGSTDALAPNETGLQAIGDHLAALNGYTSCQSSRCLYLASGTTDDWAYGELGIPAFTFEIGRFFIPDYQEVEEILWPENLPALLYAAQLAAAPYETIHGPAVSEIQSNAVVDTLQITAVVDDTAHGSQPIASAAYSIDRPTLAQGVQAQPMAAVDGQFDEPLESVTAAIPLADLGPGKHLLYITGEDGAGNRGVIAAAFISGDTPQVRRSYLPLWAN